jgi:transcriptional regulator with GAF, ATPase, and Fis domain
LSGRRGSLIPVNCGAIPEDILESELFGHERGAFTGAVNNRIGRFQLADGGTIFLDEIGEMSPKLQVKLLRVLQERKVEPVGSTRSIDVNVRIIAATNKDLREEVKAGRFREDLYYRLQVIPITLPPLRDRGSDVMVLSKFFLSRTSDSFGIAPFTISEEAALALRRHTWPGNVRELENVMERVAVLAESEKIQLSDLPEHIRSSGAECEIIETFTEMPDDGLDFNEMVNQFENKLILMALGQTNGNKKAAAELLRLNRTTLVEKIKKKGLEWSTTMTAATDPLFA